MNESKKCHDIHTSGQTPVEFVRPLTRKYFFDHLESKRDEIIAAANEMDAEGVCLNVGPNTHIFGGRHVGKVTGNPQILPNSAVQGYGGINASIKGLKDDE